MTAKTIERTVKVILPKGLDVRVIVDLEYAEASEVSGQSANEGKWRLDKDGKPVLDMCNDIC